MCEKIFTVFCNNFEGWYDMAKKKEEPQKVEVSSQYEILAGRYANSIQVTVQSEEFVLDFLVTKGDMPYHLARIFVSPGHAKRLRDLLKRQIVKYEKAFGTIKTVPEDKATTKTRKRSKKRQR